MTDLNIILKEYFGFDLMATSMLRSPFPVLYVQYTELIRLTLGTAQSEIKPNESYR